MSTVCDQTNLIIPASYRVTYQSSSVSVSVVNSK